MNSEELYRLFDKYLDNTCTPEEAERVLEFLDTPEGEEYFAWKFMQDARQVPETNEQLPRPFDSEKLFGAIEEQIESPAIDLQQNKINRTGWDGFSPFLRVAAILLFVFIGSLSYYHHSGGVTVPEPMAAAEETIYTTGPEEQKKIILKDGTHIRLNAGSELRVAPDFFTASRKVSLKGEAYVDVASNKDKPFIIQTEQASVEVLGTVFNVKSVAEEEVQVAVVEGAVSVQGTKGEAVTLEKGQFGYSKEGAIQVEETGVQNYLSWMTGRLTFDDQPLTAVCSQLTRLYGLSCGFANDALKELSLTTDISIDKRDDKLLSVIALSLDITYRRDQDRVVWLEKTSSGGPL